MGRKNFTAIGFRRVEFVFFCSRSDNIDAQWRERRPCSVEKRVYYSPCTTHCMLSVPLYNLIPPSTISPFSLSLSHRRIQFKRKYFPNKLSEAFFSHSNSEILWQWLCLLCKGMSVDGAHDEHELGPQVHWIIFHWWRVARTHNRAATHGVKMWQFFQIIFQYTRSSLSAGRKLWKMIKKFVLCANFCSLIENV